MTREEFECLPENKGWFKIVCTLMYDAKQSRQIAEETGLSKGTVGRRLDEMNKLGWVYSIAEMKDGQAVKLYCLDGRAYACLEELKHIEIEKEEEEEYDWDE